MPSLDAPLATLSLLALPVDVSTSVSTVPLYVVAQGGKSAFDMLKARVRLSGIKKESDADMIVQLALLDVRAGFFRKLGLPRTFELAAMTFVANPTTEAGALRALAYTTEVAWVRLMLIRDGRLPLIFLDGSGSALQDFNEEGATRLSAKDVEGEMLRLQNSIDENLELLGLKDALGAETEGEVYVPEPTCPPKPVGTSLWGNF